MAVRNRALWKVVNLQHDNVEAKDLTWHVLKTYGEAKVEQHVKSNKSADADPIPVFTCVLAVSV